MAKSPRLKGAPISLSGIHGRVDIKRNAHGIPEITAGSFLDCCYGIGWVHACDRQLQILLMRILLNGRMAEYLKNDPELIEIDKYMIVTLSYEPACGIFIDLNDVIIIKIQYHPVEDGRLCLGIDYVFIDDNNRISVCHIEHEIEWCALIMEFGRIPEYRRIPPSIPHRILEHKMEFGASRARSFMI